MSNPETYTCACCKGVYETGWTEEEARAEAEKNFPDGDVSQMEVVCDDCYKKVMET